MCCRIACVLRCGMLNVQDSASRRHRHHEHVPNMAAGRPASLLPLRKSDTAQHALGSNAAGFPKGELGLRACPAVHSSIVAVCRHAADCHETCRHGHVCLEASPSTPHVADAWRLTVEVQEPCPGGVGVQREADRAMHEVRRPLHAHHPTCQHCSFHNCCRSYGLVQG